MQDLFNFLWDHWFLSSALIVLIIMIVQNELMDTIYGIYAITAKDLVEYINKEEVLVIDTRDKISFKKSHIADAVNIPEGSISSQITFIKKSSKKNIVLVSGNGMSSPGVGKKLSSAGISKIAYLSGGLNAWIANGYPLVSK